jgi:peptidoglycan/LPS O-acetylase OafA/YrhL
MVDTWSIGGGMGRPRRRRSIAASMTSRRRSGKALAAVVVVAACLLALLVDVGTAQDDLIHIEGRVLWVAGATMIVAPYATDTGPIKVDLSQASQDEYMRLTTGDSVTVTGTIAPEGDRIMATSIRGRS